MKVVLVLEKSHFMFQQSFCEAFQELGISAVVFHVDNGLEYTGQRERLLKVINDENIEKLLILNNLVRDSDFFINDTVIRQIPCYLWIVDSLHLEKVHDNCLNKYSAVYSFEPEDIAYGKSQYNIDIQYLPLTMGKSLFCSKLHEPKVRKYDISFIGLVSGSKKRLEILNAVAEYCQAHQKKLVAYGHYWHDSHPLQSLVGSLRFRLKYPKLWPFVVNKRLTAEQCAQVYMNSKINLNIHIPCHTGFNCRTFEILGNGNFELCDKQNTEAIPLEDNKHLSFYESIDELIHKIQYYLSNDGEREKIAKCGGEFVNSRFSFVDILRVILENKKKVLGEAYVWKIGFSYRTCI